MALPEKVTAAPAGSSGNFALGGNDPARGRDYVMYQISGGGYGGNSGHDGLTNGCSTIGISKSPPVDKSMTVSAPQRVAHTSLSTSSATDEVTIELPILALTFTRKLRPMIIGSDSG